MHSEVSAKGVGSDGTQNRRPCMPEIESKGRDWLSEPVKKSLEALYEPQRWPNG